MTKRIDKHFTNETLRILSNPQICSKLIEPVTFRSSEHLDESVEIVHQRDSGIASNDARMRTQNAADAGDVSFCTNDMSLRDEYDSRSTFN